MITDLKDIDTKTEQGRYLMMAIALLSTTSRTNKPPWEIIEEIGVMVKDVYREPKEVKDTDKI